MAPQLLAVCYLVHLVFLVFLVFLLHSPSVLRQHLSLSLRPVRHRLPVHLEVGLQLGEEKIDYSMFADAAQQLEAASPMLSHPTP